MDTYFAHRNDEMSRVQTIQEHLQGTAELAGAFAKSFGAEEYGYAAGLLHDIGKYTDKFQRRLLGENIHVDHATAGAQVAYQNKLLEVAFAIAGHHGGIPDGGNAKMDTSADPTLLGRMKKILEPFEYWEREVILPSLPPLPVYRADIAADTVPMFARAFFIRMLHSCLVDADFLDTERFMIGGEPLRGASTTLTALLEKVRAQAVRWLGDRTADPVSQARNQVLEDCQRSGASSPPGLFTLTVPTGGGKTFSSLAFALEHAVRNGMERVIYVIPYTSIIDQTVANFEAWLGSENVLAHYSGAEHRMKEEEDLSTEEYRKLLATENWDAPIIVTSAVQFFDSLFAIRPSKCRKLHNIANSVVIFDEAQTIPDGYLRPCVAAIGQLVRHYHTSAVLCTATQPALGEMFREFAPGVPMREIASNTETLYRALRRVSLQDAGELEVAELAAQLCALPQVLCVVNRRKAAQSLFDALPEEGRFCLTTLLCPADRKAKLKEIRQRLQEGRPCRVVSTSLIEAGVDVDFPTVYRETAGLDSVIQAAGRCNREGKRPVEKCMVFVFDFPQGPATVDQKRYAQVFETVKRSFSEELDGLSAIQHYFETLYYQKGPDGLDQKGVLRAFSNGKNGSSFPFRQVAEEFRLIEENTRTIYIPAGQGELLCRRLQAREYSRSLYRQLGEYSVSVYPRHYEKLELAGALEAIDEYTAILTNMDHYNSEIGLSLDAETGLGFFV